MTNLDYGIIGNCKSAALISKRAELVWLCLPVFDSASVFASLLDSEKGGSFSFQVDEKYHYKQTYIPKTNILCTTFSNGTDAFEVLDFMPRYKTENSLEDHYAPSDLIRYVRKISGNPELVVDYNPKLEYAREETFTQKRKNYIKSFTKKGNYDSLYLYSNLEQEVIFKKKKVQISEDIFFLVSYNQKLINQTIDRAYLKLQRTKIYWFNWSERTIHYNNYNKEILRSALVLKILSYEKTGAVLAALTTSLPETIGEVRNWDYRFCWIRDASMVINAMIKTGHGTVARKFMNFLIDIVSDKDEKIQIMYGINREKNLKEFTLPHLSGYMNSAPVRIGNAAYKQKQHDIYGILMEVIYQQFNLFHVSLQNSEELWTITRSIIRTVEKNWKKPDRGIWELRTEQRHFTFSKLLCWVALDRGVKVAYLTGNTEYVKKWEKLRNIIQSDIYTNAWNEDKQAFTQAYENDDLDSSTLLMAEFGFIDPKDPKYISTVKATQKELCHKGLIYRYKNSDDFGLPSSSFTICTFWMIQALFNIGERDQAKTMFEHLLTCSNHLGLFSEDIDFETRRLLGNFPQAYSHLALIETATLFARQDEIPMPFQSKPKQNG